MHTSTRWHHLRGTIINNDGADPVAGTFSGLAQGATIVVNSTPLVISYTGGTGNDVVLTSGAPLPRVLDVDGNGSYDALTDGLLTIRSMFGLTGTSLTDGALGSTATRTDPAAIKGYLDGIPAALDVDGNTQVDALTDGLLIIRYMFGLRGSSLIAAAVGAGATRTTAPQIETHIQSLMP